MPKRPLGALGAVCFEQRFTDATACAGEAISTEAIRLCAALSAQDSGNAHQGLDILRAAGKTADDQGDDVVTVEHIREAQGKIERGNLKKRISNLTVQQRHILHALALLEADEKTPARTKEIYSLYEQVCDQSSLDPLSTVRSVRDHLDELSMQGFADQITRNERRSGGKYHVYECSMRPDLVLSTGPRDE